MAVQAEARRGALTPRAVYYQAGTVVRAKGSADRTTVDMHRPSAVMMVTPDYSSAMAIPDHSPVIAALHLEMRTAALHNLGRSAVVLFSARKAARICRVFVVYQASW